MYVRPALCYVLTIQYVNCAVQTDVLDCHLLFVYCLDESVISYHKGAGLYKTAP